MTRSKTTVGAGLLLALCLCIFGSAGASATSIYRCEEVASGGTNIDNHCIASIGEKKFATVRAEGPVSVVMASQEAATLITGVIAGVPVKVRCASMSGSGTAENFVNEKKENEVKGSALGFKFSECAVEEPKKGCLIKGGEFESTTLTALTAMQSETVTQVSLSPAAGKPYGELQVEKCSVSGLNGTYKLMGSLVGTVDGEVASKINFTKAGTEAGGLTLAGNKAGLEGSFHQLWRNEGGGPPSGTAGIENP